MLRIGIVTTGATSLKVVGETLVYAFKKLNFDAKLYPKQLHWFDALKLFDRAIIVVPFDPIYLPSWLILQRDYNNYQLYSVTYVTVEGKPKRWLVRDWVRRDGKFVANSNYTASMLQEIGIKPLATIPHALNFEEIDAINVNKKEFKEKYQAECIFGTVAFGIERKGLDRLASAIKNLKEKLPNAKFYILTSPQGTHYFEGLKNVIVSHQFGKLSREEVLSLIASFDFYICSSLAEGFCLPVLEAQALSVPCVFPDYSPLNEITAKKGNIPFPYVKHEYMDMGYGMLYEIHDYKVEDMMKAIEKAYEIFTKDPKTYKRMQREVRLFSKKFDAVKVYRDFLTLEALAIA